jgi:hypothetical protein
VPRASATFEASIAGGLAGAPFFNLCSGDPGTTGANEIVATRSSVAWSGGANTGTLTTSVGTGVTVSFWGTWSASTSGTFQIGGALSATITFVTAGTFTIAPGALTVTAA